MQWSKESTIVTKKADKGGGTILINWDDYIREAEKQLEDRTVYKKLMYDPTEEIKREIDMLLQEAVEQGTLYWTTKSSN